LVLSPVLAQKLVQTTGEGQVEWTSKKSEDEVKKEARQKATIDALRKAFGEVVYESNAMYIKNRNTGTLTETNTVFNMIGDIEVKGEEVEEINEDFETIQGTRTTGDKTIEVKDIKCVRTILAREMTTPPIEFKAFPLGCPNINCKKTEFMDGDDLYFYFKSPVTGCLSIYIDDGEVSQQVLPYQAMPPEYEGGIKVRADQEYYFFKDSKEYDYFEEEDNYIREYKLYAKSLQDQNQIFVIFTKTPLNKVALRDGNEDELTEAEQKANYTMPLEANSKDFIRWLIKNKSHREDMQISRSFITITRD